MALPSGEKECRHAVDVLEQLLELSDVKSAAEGALHTRQHSTVTLLTPVEETIVSNSRLVREQAAVLLGKLRAALSASGAADGSSSASPEFAAFQLFIRKSRLLHERVERVTVAFSSLKHAALLGENSTGRRVITDRASVSITELLDILMAAVSTLEESTLPSETEQKSTPSLPSSSRYVVLGTHSPIGVLDTKFTDSTHTPRKTTSCLDAKQRGAVLKHEREVMGEGVTTKDSDLTGDEEKKKTETTAWNKKNDEKGEAFTRSEKSKNVLPREEKKESTHVFTPRKSSPSSTISSFSNTTASCGPMNKSTHSSSVLLHRNIDNNKKNSRHGTLSTSHSSSDTTGENVGSLETIATAHCVPIEKSSSVDDELLEPKHSPLPANTTVRTPVHKGDTATPSLVSTYRSTHKRLFRGKLWRELLHKDGDDTATSRWKEVFIQEVALLFGIPTAWVSNVELVNDTPTHARVLHGGDQEVMFKVRLPLSLAKDEVNMRIQRHEFLNMLLLYEELQKEKEEMEEAKEREKKDKHEKSDADTSNVSSFSKDDDGSTSPPEFENTEVLLDDAEACDVDLKNNSTGNLFGNNKDWSGEFLSLIHKETQSRDSLTIQEKYGRQFVLKASAKNWKKLGGAEVHGEEKQDKRSSYRQLHAAEQQEQQQEPEQGIEREVSGEMEVNKPSRPTLPPLPPRSFTLPQQMPLSSSASSLDKEETPSPAPVPTPLNIAMETRDDVDHKDSNILQNEESLKINRVPKPFQEKNIVSSQKLWEPTVQLISTCHEKIIKGDKWDIVLEKEKDELHRTFVVEVSNLFELPTEHVKELQFALGSLHASFTLMHDRYLQETEINALLAIFDFPQIRSLYERCLEGTKGSEPADLKGDISKKNIINNNGHGSLKGSNDQRLLSSASASSSVVPANDERGMKTSNDNSNNSPKAHGEASVPRLATKVLIHSTRMPTCRPRSSVDVLRKSTATPDNEPITLTHLSLLHDVTIDELLKANPSLAILHPNEPIPSYTEIVIPRATMDSDHDDDECGIRESTDELNLSNIAMPIRISLTSSSHSIQTDDADGDVLKSLMNVKNIATNFGVGVQAFREQNTHLHSYGDLDPIPKNSPINIPAQMLPSSDSRGDNLSYFTTSQRRAMSRPSVLDDSLTQDAEEKKNVNLSLKSNPLTHKTDNVGEQEESLRKSETKPISQESSKTGEPPNQVNTKRFPTVPHNNSILTGTRSHPHPTHSSSTVMNPPISCENAVLVVRRSIEYFCLLRFFVKWQQIIQLKQRGQKLLSVHEISLGGANPRRGAYMDPVLSNSRYQITRRGVGQLNPRQLSTPRRETGPEHRVNLISRAIQAIAHVQHRGVSPRNVNSMISTLWGRLPSQTSQQIIQGRSSGNRTVSARSRVNRREDDRRGQSPVKSSRGVNQTNPFMSSGYRGAPHPIFIASSNRFYSHAQNPERRSSKTYSSRALSDWLPLDIRVSSSLIILEAYGEAEAAGIQRGDQLREVEGVSVQSLKELGKVLESSNGTHIRVKILKKKSENITTIRLRRCTREALDITTSRSTSSSPTEPRITPMLSASKSSAFPSTRNHGHNPILLDRQQYLNNNAPNRPRRGY